MKTNRRIRLDLNVPAELAIYNAMQEVEKAGADVRLTNAVIKLADARNLVADYVDGVPAKEVILIKPELTKAEIEQMTFEEFYRHYFPGASKEEIDFFLWEKTPFPFDTKDSLNMIYRRYVSVMKSLFIPQNPETAESPQVGLNK